MVELLGVVTDAGAAGISTGKGWELEFTLAPWRPAPPAKPIADPPENPLRDAENVRPEPLRVRGAVIPEELDGLVADLAPGRTVRVAAALSDPSLQGVDVWAKLDEVIGVEPPDDRLEAAADAQP
ncbi:hypothetical protein LzC2_42670 [Planctomycetes bacterium LzC2]|uniref:Uncharacterized protein n=1 Tax=Alienimonas chondri TaxID=2681879 RepID=A0ABX1VPG1_9PLAN|nr:hypothetical protein [Alienimonas chondri]